MNKISELARIKGISISELARRCDMEPHTLRRYARGESEPRSDLAVRLADIFGCMPTEVLGLEPLETEPLGKIPLYGPVNAGTWDGETAMDRAVDHIARPSFLMGQSNAYAVFVVGSSMEPRFNAGEILYIDPDVPIRQGADVVVQLNHDGELTAVVKRFISTDNSGVRLKQLNPALPISFDKEVVTSIHAVQGSWLRA
tara:strand:+ start:758 stop:1354 length:597 start_codon:yes stop_codon:yes gene_type:complete